MQADTCTKIWCSFSAIFFLFLVVGLPLISTFTRGGGSGSMNPTFYVESTSVKAYNLTSDNLLFCIINIIIVARNHNQKEKYSFDFTRIDMEVRKGKHHKLADDALANFRIGPGSKKVVDVEAVGLRVRLKKKIAREVRADVAAGEGLVNLYMTGHVGSDDLGVTCEDVVVDFSRSMVRVDQIIGCRVSVTTPNDENSAV